MANENLLWPRIPYRRLKKRGPRQAKSASLFGNPVSSKAPLNRTSPRPAIAATSVVLLACTSACPRARFRARDANSDLDLRRNKNARTITGRKPPGIIHRSSPPILCFIFYLSPPPLSSPPFFSRVATPTPKTPPAAPPGRAPPISCSSRSPKPSGASN